MGAGGRQGCNEAGHACRPAPFPPWGCTFCAAVSGPPLSSSALECLVRLASVRRSLFATESERSNFLNRLVRAAVAAGRGWGGARAGRPALPRKTARLLALPGQQWARPAPLPCVQVGGTRDIMAKGTGLNQHANYHELCRLLGRLKTNFQLTELVAVEQYEGWIQLVADLTITSLHSWQWAAGW